MKVSFQFGFLLGSIFPLAALCFLGHSERVCLAAGAGFLLVPALLWPRRVGGWLEWLGRFYERLALRPARSAGRVKPSSGTTSAGLGGPDRRIAGCVKDPSSANAKPKEETAGGTQDIVVQTLVTNYRCPKRKAQEIAQRVSGIQDEDARVIAAMRMVRA